MGSFELSDLRTEGAAAAQAHSQFTGLDLGIIQTIISNNEDCAVAKAVVLHPLRWLTLSAALSVASWSAWAFDATKLEDFKTTNVCKYCDLTDAPMSGRDMRGADFQNANLSGAVLSKSNMGERPMEKRTLVTNFEDANLRRADFSGANLHLANFTNAYLREANLTGADLSDAVLTKANLKGAVLNGANLKGAKLDDAKLDDAKFCKTTMPDGAVNDSGC